MYHTKEIETSSYSHHVLTGLQVLSENTFDESASISTDDGLRSQSGTLLQAQENTDTETVVQDQKIDQSESVGDNNLSRAVSTAYHHHTLTNINLE